MQSDIIYLPWDRLQASVRSVNDTADLRVIDAQGRHNTRGSLTTLQTRAVTNAVQFYRSPNLSPAMICGGYLLSG